MADQDAPVAVWIDDCGRSFVTADEYATALEEIERLRNALRATVDMLYHDCWTPEERDTIRRLAFDDQETRP